MFKEMENTQAFLKAGLLGFAGSGKSTTATNIAGGLVLHMRKKEMELANKPVYFLDTECGADWIKPLLETQDIKLNVWKTRAFKDLLTAIDMSEKESSVLIIDSLTHFWTELTETYMKRKNRNYLAFNDWSFLKAEWRKFTDKYINSNLHIILCGRAGYEYDYFETDELMKNGKQKMELAKTGIKMKAENETGYEASLLILMERHQKLENGSIGKQYRTATILKDRSRAIDGRTFENPTFKDFLPHIGFLNLGGNHQGVDLDRDSSELIDNKKDNVSHDRRQKDITLDEIKEVLTKYYPSTKAEDKKAKGDILEEFAGIRSWQRLETFDLYQVKEIRDKMYLKLEGKTYEETRWVKKDDLEDEIPDYKTKLVTVDPHKVDVTQKIPSQKELAAQNEPLTEEEKKEIEEGVETEFINRLEQGINN